MKNMKYVKIWEIWDLKQNSRGYNSACCFNLVKVYVLGRFSRGKTSRVNKVRFR